MTSSASSDPAAPPAAPAKSQPPVWATLLVLPALALAILILWKAFPFSLWLIGGFMLWIIPNADVFEGKAWARMLKSLINPALAALAILTVFVAALKFFDSPNANLIANWEDRLILSLNEWLKHFTTWKYVALLVVATLISWRFPRLKAVSRLKTWNGWLRTATGIVAIMANVSFLGQQSVVAPRYNGVVENIKAKYRTAEEQKIQHIERALATEALAQNLQQAAPEDVASMRNSIAALDRLQLPDRYRNTLAGGMAFDAGSLRNSSRMEAYEIRQLASSDADAIASATPDRLIAATEKARQDADEAAHQETDAKNGLREVITTVIGQGNGKIADTAMSFYKPLISTLGLDIFEPLTEAIHDQATDSIKDWLKDHEKPLVKIALDRAAAALHWKDLPQEPAEQLAAGLRAQALDLARQNRESAANELKEITETGASPDDDTGDPDKNIQSAKSQGEEADQVLSKLGSTQQAGTAQSEPVPSTYWDNAARRAGEMVASRRQHIQEEEHNREMREQPAERP